MRLIHKCQLSDVSILKNSLLTFPGLAIYFLFICLNLLKKKYLLESLDTTEMETPILLIERLREFSQL